MIYKRIGHWHLDVTIHGVRYREALNTTDKRQAKELEKNRTAEIKQGKNASKTGREFARKPFHEAVKVYLEEREPHVSERTMQFESERLGPLVKHFGERPLLRFKAEDVSGYQRARLDAGISGRTVNMETAVLRRMLKPAKVWNAISEDVKALPEDRRAVAKVLPPDLKRKLFETAASRPEWMVAHCAAVLAVSTTCGGIEITNLRGQDVDLFSRVATIRRSQAAAGHLTVPLNRDAWPHSLACSNAHEPSAAANPTFSPPARSGSSIPHARRRAGAQLGASWSAKPPGAWGERPHNRRSNPGKVCAARSQSGNEPPPRSAVCAFTTSATRRSLKWPKRARRTPR